MSLSGLVLMGRTSLIPQIPSTLVMKAVRASPRELAFKFGFFAINMRLRLGDLYDKVALRALRRILGPRKRNL